MIIKNLLLQYKSLLLIILLASFTISVYADNKNNLLYNGFTASYDVNMNGFDLGVSERQLIKESSTQYTYKSYTYATGVARWFIKDKITESSHYQLLNNTINPIRYDYKNSNGKSKDNYSIIFDTKKNTATRTKDNITHIIADNEQDLLSFQIAIIHAIQQHNKNIKFTIVDNKRIGEYTLNHTKNEKLKTESGEIDTFVMESNSIKNKYRFTFWCAKQYDYFPIKMQRIKNNGDVLLIQLNRLNGKEINLISPYDDEDEDF